MSNEATARPQPDTLLGLGSSDGLGPLPKPDGWIYDGHPDGLQFKRQAITGIEALVRSIAPMFTAHQMRTYAAREVAAERERMIADGWRQTKYVAPVTDCESCLTPDACAIRGQCGHYLRERDSGPNEKGNAPV